MNFREIQIGNRLISNQSSPYIIAEIGSNFNQDLETAFKLIDVAVDAKADAVKFQLFKASNLYPNRDGLYDVFKSIELNHEWIPKLIEYCTSKKIEFLCSAFDFESFELLEKNNLNAHKIASSETTNFEFISKVASSGKPIIISTGMCDIIDVIESVNICKKNSNDKFIILQCSSIYPLDYVDVNLDVIKTYKKLFNSIIGFSDHTKDNVAAVTAVGVGARVIEKHITLDRNMSGPDHSYATEPKDFLNFCQSIRDAFKSIGCSDKKMLQVEKDTGRRDGIYAKNNLSKGSVLNFENVVIKRPAIGLRARYLANIIGLKIKKDLKKDQAITSEIIDI